MAVLSILSGRSGSTRARITGGLFTLALVATFFSTVLAAVQDSDLESDNDFANNLFSDLAPILALFGERFAQQYMSYSTEFLDSVVFALAPLGVLTAIVGAIRVAGPPILRSLIGRAREPDALAEMELQSSTSHEVCELWNGTSIVRVMGTPDIKQFLFFENVDWDSSHVNGVLRTITPQDLESGRKQKSERIGITNFDPKQHTSNNRRGAGLFTREEAEEAGLIKQVKEWKLADRTLALYRDFTKGLRNLEKRKQPASVAAPNICLNLSTSVPGWELKAATVTGIIMQGGAVLLAGLVAYVPSMLKLDIGVRNSYSFPLYAAGTFLLTLGMLIAAVTIDRSTEERRWETTDKSTRMYILWIQYGKVINDQLFESHVLFRPGTAKEFCESQRKRAQTIPDVNLKPYESTHDHKTNTKKGWDWWSEMEAVTVFNSITTILGFIAQLMGLRGMHSAASGGQLAALSVMTIIRALLRRGVSAAPIAYKVKAGFELDWLAAALARSKWSLGTEYAIDANFDKKVHKDTFLVETFRIEGAEQGLRTGKTVKGSNNTERLAAELEKLGFWFCESCGERIVQIRYECTECFEYHYCEVCFAEAPYTHPANHEFRSENVLESLRQANLKKANEEKEKAKKEQRQKHNPAKGQPLPMERVLSSSAESKNVGQPTALGRTEGESVVASSQLKAHSVANGKGEEMVHASISDDLKTAEHQKRGEQPSSKLRSNEDRREPVVLRIRRELAGISGMPPGPATDISSFLTKTIEKTLSTLYPPSEEMVSEFQWSIRVYLASGAAEATSVDIHASIVERASSKFWVLDPGKHLLEAIISLWWYSIAKSETSEGSHGGVELHTRGSPGRAFQEPEKGLRLVGTYTESLLRDLHWWMPETATYRLQIFTIRPVPPAQARNSSNHSLLFKDQIRLQRSLLHGYQLPRGREGEPQIPPLGPEAENIYPYSEYDLQKHILLQFRNVQTGTERDAPLDTDARPRVTGSFASREGQENRPDEREGSEGTGCMDGLNIDSGESQKGESRESLGVLETIERKYVLSQHIFAQFMHVAASRLGSKKLTGDMNVTLRKKTASQFNWRNFQLSNTKITQIVHAAFNCGLCRNIDEGYLCVVPALSYLFKLPDEAAVNELVRQVEKGDADFTSLKGAKLYTGLFGMLSKSHSNGCRFTVKAVVSAIEYLVRLRNALKDLRGESTTGGIVDQINAADDEMRRALAKLRGEKELLGILFEYCSSQDHDEAKQVLLEIELDYALLVYPWSEFLRFKIGHSLHRICHITAETTIRQKWLINKPHKTMVNIQDVTGCTPLHYLARRIRDLASVVENAESVPVPISRKDRPEARKEVLDRKGNKSSDAADQLENTPNEMEVNALLDCMEMLVDQGANPKLADAGGRTVLHVIAVSNVAHAPAVFSRRKDVIDKLLQKGELDIAAHDGATPLHYAARHDPGMLQYFLTARDSFPLMKGDKLRRTPLHWAAFDKSGRSVQYLLKSFDIDPTARDKFNLTPLHLAISRGNFNAVEHLVTTHGLELEDENRRTAVQQALVRITRKRHEYLGLPDSIETKRHQKIQLEVKCEADIEKLRLEQSISSKEIEKEIGKLKKQIRRNALELDAQIATLEEQQSGSVMELKIAIKILEPLLRANPQLSHTDNEGRSAVHHAFLLPNLDGCFDSVEELLKRIRNNRHFLREHDNKGLTPFLAAVSEQEDIGSLQKILDRLYMALRDDCGIKKPGTKSLAGAPESGQLWHQPDFGVLRLEKSGNNALHLFLNRSFANESSFDVASTAQKLVNVIGGASFQVQNSAGQVPLHIYCKRQSDSKLFEVLSGSSECVATISMPDSEGHTPLHVCCLESNAEALKHLVSVLKGNVNVVESGISEVAVVGESADPSVDSSDENVSEKTNNTAESELQKQLNLTDKKGRTPLVLAITPQPSASALDVVTELLKLGLDVNTLVSSAGSATDETALHRATKVNWAEVTKLLIESGAKVNQVNSKRRSPVHYAAKYGNLNLLKTLLECQSKSIRIPVEQDPQSLDKHSRREHLRQKNLVDLEDRKCRTALALACALWETKEGDDQNAGLLPVLEFLIEKGAERLTVDDAEKTTLHLVCLNPSFLKLTSEQRLKVAQVLLEGHQVASPSVSVNEGYGGLEVLSGKSESILGLADSNSRTALSLAVQKNVGMPIVQYFLSKMKACSVQMEDHDGSTALEHVLRTPMSVDVLTEHLKAFAKARFLFSLEGSGFPYLARSVSRPVLTNKDDQILRTLLESSGTAGGRGEFGSFKKEFVALRNILELWGKWDKIKVLQEHLGESSFQMLLDGSDVHGWTGYMFSEELNSTVPPDERSEIMVPPIVASKWSEYGIAPYLSVTDHLTVAYPYSATLFRRRVMVLADHPFSPYRQPEDVSARYFEIELQESGGSLTAVGLVNSFNGSMYGLLGYSTEGVAWHSDDGKVYQRLPEQSEQVLGVAKDAARFVIGDTVGCGIDKEGDLFFTKNGILVSFIPPEADYDSDDESSQANQSDSDETKITLIHTMKGPKGQLFPAISIQESTTVKGIFKGDSHNTFKFDPFSRKKNGDDTEILSAEDSESGIVSVDTQGAPSSLPDVKPDDTTADEPKSEPESGAYDVSGVNPGAEAADEDTKELIEGSPEGEEVVEEEHAKVVPVREAGVDGDSVEGSGEPTIADAAQATPAEGVVPEVKPVEEMPAEGIPVESEPAAEVSSETVPVEVKRAVEVPADSNEDVRE